MKYIIPCACILFLIILFYIIKNIIRNKKIYQLLLNNKDSYELIKVKHKGYDYVYKGANKDIYIKLAYVPNNSQICINSKETWKLSWSSVKQSPGKAYPNSRYMDELTNFLMNDIKTSNNKEILKLIFVYKKLDSLIMYLNETELDTVDINKSPYDYKITTYNTFENDKEVIFK